MIIESKDRLNTAAPAPESAGQKKPKKQKTPKKPRKARGKNRLPEKRTMNLYYKPDRTTRPATVALYVLFALVCLLGLAKFLVYDVWMETNQARNSLASAQAELNGVMAELKDYNEVKERYQRYAATEEERELIDRMEILDLLDSAVGTSAEMQNISVSGNTVQLQFSGVTLAQTARIVRALEASPIVASTTVNTAATTRDGLAPDELDDSGLVQANVLIYLQKEAAE